MRVLLIGGGKIGSAIVNFLTGTNDYKITVADHDEESLQQYPQTSLETLLLDVRDSDAVKKALRGHEAVISALPYFLTTTVARFAAEAGVHYLDLTEDVESTSKVKKYSQGAKTAFIPQCGLAPGFVSIAAYDLASSFEEIHNIHMRVGALPKYPSNALKYNLTWSTDGLINEYCNPCQAIRDGAICEVVPLESIESFGFDGVDYEAFNTSGGLGTLCETLEGKVRTLDYKTVRYPGHRDIMKLLVHDLRLGERRHLLKDVLETAIPVTLQDVVLIFVTVNGIKGGELHQESFARKIYSQELGGRRWGAIQITTASSVCAVLDLLREGNIPQSGFVRQEDISLETFLFNRFGKYYS